MTALKEYERLEAIGLWRETEDAQRREVVVSFGAASLVLSDKNDMPLAHWSLAAVRVLSKGELPVVYAPDTGDDETLEIDDPLMVEAIDKVRQSLHRSQTHPGRLRWLVAGVVGLAIAGFSIWGLPSISAQYAVQVMPVAKRQQIGEALLAKVSDLTGKPCSDDLGQRALDKMRDWLLGPDYQLYVVDMGARFSTHLPGNIVLINRSLVEEYSGPEVAAGFVLMELAHAQEVPPMQQLFNSIGTQATLTFLANGRVSEAKLAEFATARLSGPLVRPDDRDLLALFAKVGLTSSPFAHALDNSLATTQGLIDADPVKVDYQPRLKDGDWIALQGICSG